MLKKVNRGDLPNKTNYSGAQTTKENVEPTLDQSEPTPPVELTIAKSDLENHTPIDTSLVSSTPGATEKNWHPDNSPDADSPIPPGKVGGLSQANFWDPNNPNSVKSRMFWNTRRFTNYQAFQYAANYKQPIIIDRNKQIEEAWNKLPLYTQDIIKASGFPDDTYGIQRYLWQKAYDNANILAEKLIAQRSVPNQAELGSTVWGPVDDTGNLKIVKFDPRSDPHNSKYNPKYDPNNPAYSHSLDPLLMPKTVIQLLSESKTPYKVILGRVFWITGRYTSDQAYLYLRNKGYIEPYKAQPCVVEPWNESFSDLQRYIYDKIACTDTFHSIEDAIGEIGQDLFYIGIGLLLIGGYLVYNNQNAIASGARTVASYGVSAAKVGAEYGSNLIPGGAYIKAKQKEATARGVSLKEVLSEDVGRAYNPVGIIQNVAQYQ